MYLDVGANWNVSDKTQLYSQRRQRRPTPVRRMRAARTPTTRLYDVIGRLYRVGVRFAN